VRFVAGVDVVGRLGRLIEVGQALTSELDLEVLLGRVLGAAREVTGARFAALGVLDERRRGLERFVTSGLDERARARIGGLPRGRGVLGVLIDDPRPLRLADVGAHPRSFGFPLGHPPMRSFLGVPVVVRGRAWGNLYLTEKQGGGAFSEEDERALVVLAAWAAIAVDNARLYRQLAARRDELERMVRGLETTTEVALSLGGEVDVGRIVELVVKRSRALVSARAGLLGLIEGVDVRWAACAGEIDGGVVGVRTPRAGSVAGQVVASGRAERLAAVRSRVAFRLGDHVDVDSALMVPLVFRGRALGLLCAFDRLEDGPEFTGEDERLMLAFAASAATALATAQDAAADARRRSIRASEEERRRWARELHDDTLQDLAAIRIALSSARRAEHPHELQSAVDNALERLGETVDDLRGLIADLRPAALDQIGLQAALHGLARRIKTTSGLHVSHTIALADDRRLNTDLESCLYRVAQEALTNVIKHAHATHVTLTLTDHHDHLTLTITDNGHGLHDHHPDHGWGIIGMRERLAQHHGHLTITPTPHGGTTLTATIPTPHTTTQPLAHTA
jgi:signal transduction histidine kinase